MDINERIAMLRKERNLSADDVAKALGVSRATIYRYESKDIEKIPTSALTKLADCFHVSIDYLLGHVNDPFFYLDNNRILQEINSYGEETDQTKNTPATLTEDDKEQKKEASAVDTAKAIREYVETKLGREATEDELAIVAAAADGLIERLKQQRK